MTNESKVHSDVEEIVSNDVDTNEGLQKVKAKLDAGSDRVDDWLMKLNEEKCVVVHIVPNFSQSQREFALFWRTCSNVQNFGESQRERS